MRLASSVSEVTITENVSTWSIINRMILNSSNDSSSLGIHVQLDRDGVLVGVVVVGVILSIFILVAIVGNILVIVAIITERNLRRAGNNFLISLAVADALVACLVMIFAAANDLTDRWSFGTVFCIFWQSSDVMCCTASILNICAVSLDRYIHIRDPLRYRSVVTHRRSLVAVTVIWTSSAILSFLPISLGWHRLGKTTTTGQNETHAMPPLDNILWTTASVLKSNSSAPFLDSEQTSNVSLRGAEGGGDEESACHLDLNPWYACISSAISFYIPCAVMIVIYIRLYRLSMKHRKFMTSTTAVGGDTQRPRSSKFRDAETVTGDACSTLRQGQEHQSDSGQTLHRNGVSRTASVNADDRRPRSGFDFQTVPIVTVSSVLDESGRDFSIRRCSNTSAGPGSEVVRVSRHQHGTELLSLRRSSTLSSRMMNSRPSITSASLIRQTDYKAAVTVGCIIGIFLFCWGPFFVINIIGSVWEGSIPPFAFVFFTWLGYINSCANPIIYGITNVEFRRAFVRILTSRCDVCCRCRLLRRPVTARQQEWSDNNNCYRQVRTTTDSPPLVNGIN